MMESQLATIQNNLQLEKFAMRSEDLTGQVALIQKVMDDVMRKDEHYGKVPGTNKPTLLQPGAEKLILTFRLDPQFKILNSIEEKDFIAYILECTLYHIPTGNRVASGVGACNSRESKYRFRYEEESTGKSIPKAYWDAKKVNNNKEMKRLLGGDGFRASKIDGVWVIAKAKKVEHDNPWDFQNTILKMAAKRAKVAATINATAASDIFTQDVEDLPMGDKVVEEQEKNDNGKQSSQKPNQNPTSKPSTNQNINSESHGDSTLKSLFILFQNLKLTSVITEDYKRYCYDKYSVESMEELTPKQKAWQKNSLQELAKNENNRKDFEKHLLNLKAQATSHNQPSQDNSDFPGPPPYEASNDEALSELFEYFKSLKFSGLREQDFSDYCIKEYKIKDINQLKPEAIKKLLVELQTASKNKDVYQEMILAKLA